MLETSSLAAASWPERRAGGDRRRTGMGTLLGAFTHGRRRGLRRPGDAAAGNFYLDIPDSRALIAAFAVLLCSCADSVFTLRLLEQGASEVNPLMLYLIETETTLFVGIKTAITLAGLAVIVIHAHFRLFRILRGRHVVYGLSAMYLFLVSYEIALLQTLAA